MAKKHWLYLKRGLSEDPKHREAMGMAVWLFMHICDAAEFETGTVYDWRDKEIAVDMTLSTNTVREWRSRLVEKHYITCKQRQHGIEITIHNWINPRDYSGKKINIYQGESVTPPLEIEGESQGTGDLPQGESQGESQVLTPAIENFTPFIESESESDSLNIRFSKIQTALEKMGAIVTDARMIDIWTNKHTDEWIQKAIDITIAKGIRNCSYVNTILAGWLENGYPQSKQRKQSTAADQQTPLEKYAASIGAI